MILLRKKSNNGNMEMSVSTDQSNQRRTILSTVSEFIFSVLIFLAVTQSVWSASEEDYVTHVPIVNGGMTIFIPVYESLADTTEYEYHFLNESIQSPAVYAIDKASLVQVNDRPVESVARYTKLDVGSLSQGDVIYSDYPLSIGSEVNGTDMPVPIEFASDKFVIPLYRGTHYIYVKNIESFTVTGQFFNGVSQSSFSVDSGEIVRLATSNNGGASTITVDNGGHILVSHKTSSNGDAYPVPPALNTVYGINSNAYAGAYANNTVFTSYASNGSVTDKTIGLNQYDNVGGTNSADGLGNAVKITSSGLIAGIQLADSDGDEATSFWPLSMFASQFVLPVDAQYVAIVCFSDVEIEIYHAPTDDDFGGINQCSGTLDNPGKAFFGSASNETNVQLLAGSQISAYGGSIYVIYETFATDDEHNLIGYADFDGDGILNLLDSDDDNDGTVDTEDAFPYDESESLDSDGDGIGNNQDTDDDGDGVPDDLDLTLGEVDELPVVATDVSPSPNSGSASVGSIGGAFRVSEQGAATYSLAIDTYAGTAGVAPIVSLEYSSAGGNGIAGIGWSISAIRSITRCNQTLLADGQIRPLDGSSEDRFCLDGQRLILVSGTYGSAGSVYRTQIDSTEEITAVGGTAGSPDYFEVRAKDGSISTLGAFGDDTDNSEIGDGSIVTVWQISEFKDNENLSSPNKITFEYLNDEHGVNIEYIRYAYDLYGIDHAHIYFNYVTDIVHPIRYKSIGPDMVMDRRLTQIDSSNGIGSSVTVNYILNYDEADYVGSNNDSLSRLTSIEKCFDTYTCLDNPITFSWSGHAFAFTETEITHVDMADSGKFASQYLPIDINGDGKKDLIWLRVDPDAHDPKDSSDQFLHYAMWENGQLINKDFVTAQGSDTVDRYWYGENPFKDEDTIKLEIIDYNADGRQDLMLYNEDHDVWTLFLATPKLNGKWGLSKRSTTFNFSGTLEDYSFADLNGDGLADAYRSSETDDELTITYYAAEKASVSNSSAMPYQFSTTAETKTYAKPNFSNVTETSQYYLMESETLELKDDATPYGMGDFNGDGITDMLYIARYRYYEHQSYKVYNPNPPPASTTHSAWGYLAVAYGGQEDDLYIAAAISGGNIEEASVLDVNLDGIPDVVFKQDGASGVASKVFYFGPKVQLREPWSSSYVATLLDSFHSYPSDEEKNVSFQMVDLNQDRHPDYFYYNTNDNGLYVKYWDADSETFGSSVLLYEYPDLYVEAGELPELWIEQHIKDIGGHSLIDFNGSGTPELIIYRPDSSQYAVLETSSNTFLGHHIERITNSMGVETDITFELLTQTDHYTRVEGIGSSYPNLNLCFDVIGHSYDYGYDCGFATVNADEFYAQLNDPFSDIGNLDHIDLSSIARVYEFNAPLPVVTSVYSSSPTASDLNAKVGVEYYYSELKIQPGIGSLGFKRLITKDLQTQVQTKTLYRQDWPFVGMPLSTVQYLEQNGQPKVISESSNVSSLQWIANSNVRELPVELAGQSSSDTSGIWLPKLRNSIESIYSYSSSKAFGVATLDISTTELARVEKDFVYDLWSNLTSSITRNYNEGVLEQTETNVNTYTGVSGWDDTEAQRYGRLKRSSVTRTRPNQNSITRTVDFRYYPWNEGGLLKQEITEFGATLELATKTYNYDSNGNITSTEIAAGGTSRTSQVVYDDVGRYATKTLNSYGQTISEVLSRNAFGIPTSTKDIKGNITTIKYDEAGNQYYSYTENGASSYTYQAWCTGDCIGAGAVFKKIVEDASGAESAEYFDALGRSVAKQAKHFDGLSYVTTRTDYDSFGRVERVSEPYLPGDTIYWQSTEYDTLGNVLLLTDADGQPTEIAYDGNETTTTNALDQVKIETRNSLAEVVSVEDHLGGKVEYSFDSFGNLAVAKTSSDNRATNVPAEIEVEIFYDILGRKYKMVDPDKGTWYYRYNGYGELVAQVNGEGHCTKMDYDLLGRMVVRQDYESYQNAPETRTINALSCTSSFASQSSWNYANGTDNTDPAIGDLTSVYHNYSAYSQHFFYDELGRLTETETRIASHGSYFEKTTYDDIGRPYQIFDGARETQDYSYNGIRHHYNDAGALEKITSAQRVGSDYVHTYYEIDAVNARGQVTRSYMNGDIITRENDYYETTGLIRNISAYGGAFGKVQDLSLVWDEVGNLESKHSQGVDKNLNSLDLQHGYCYDGLNRLTDVKETLFPSCGGIAKYQYDGFGNITSKDGNTYTYWADRPHAVKTAYGNTYNYDQNGSQTSGDGRTITYTHFDKASQISKGATTINFDYGPNRNRYKKVENSGGYTTTTLYIGSVEKVISYTGSYRYRRYINGVAVEMSDFDSSGNLTSTPSVTYLMKDHLSSTDVILSPLGEVVETQSFDPWGQRRDADDWTSLSDLELRLFSSAVTPRGFTGQEMLDKVGVVHMNGRIYDPKLARFMQADPFIQAGKDVQMYNRYSYTRNNPLNATDPSGYFLAALGLHRLYELLPAKEAAIFNSIATIVAAWACGPCSIAVAAQTSAQATYAQTGSLSAAVRSGTIAGVTAAAFHQVGGIEGIGKAKLAWSSFADFGASLGNVTAKVALHGMIGGVSAALSGGEFGNGFASAGFSAFASTTGIYGPLGEGPQLEGVLGSVIVGGTSSVLSGGKFANGAATALLGYLLNSASQSSSDPKECDCSNLTVFVKQLLGMDTSVEVAAKASAAATSAPAKVDTIVTSYRGPTAIQAMYDQTEGFTGHSEGLYLTVDVSVAIEYGMSRDTGVFVFNTPQSVIDSLYASGGIITDPQPDYSSHSFIVLPEAIPTFVSSSSISYYPTTSVEFYNLYK